MAYRHFLRTWAPVRIGGWRVGRQTFGAGTYAAVPLSVLAVQQLLPVLQKIGEAMPQGAEQIFEVVKTFPGPAIAPIIPLLVEPRVRRRHLSRISLDQAVAVLVASQRVNDWEYIFEKMTPEEGEEGVPLEVMAVRLAERFGMEPRDWLVRPMQEFLAVIDALAGPTAADEQPLNDDDRSLLRNAGFKVN